MPARSAAACWPPPSTFNVLNPPRIIPGLLCSFVCPTEITAFSDRHDEFAALNTEVLGVSIDSQFSHLAWIQTGESGGGSGLKRCSGAVAAGMPHAGSAVSALAL